jgi:hypothetical protein
LLTFYFFLGSLLFAQVSSDDRIVFPPLNANEELAYSTIGDGPNIRFRLFAHTQQKQDFRLLGEWQGVNDWNGLEFSQDRKYCYFTRWALEKKVPDFSLFFVDGVNGRADCIMTHMKGAFRSSSDGHYLVFKDPLPGDSSKTTRFTVYNSLLGSKVGSTTWNVDSGDGSFVFRRGTVENTIRVFLAGEGGYVLSAAEINPGDLTLNEIFNDPDARSKISDKQWQDDVSVQLRDQTLKRKS